MTHPRKTSSMPRTTAALRTGLVLTAAVVLAGCAGTAPEHASMLQTTGYGQTSVAPISGGSRQVNLVPVTAQTIDQYAGSVAASQGGAYLLGMGDIVQLYVVDEPELTVNAGYRVDADGSILVPYLGRVAVADRSVEMVRSDLVARLSQYRAQPQVDVRITDFNARHVSVVGEVRQPNRQTLTDQPLTAIDAINAAGGFREDPSRAHVVLIRGGVEQGVDVQAFLSHGQALPALQDGDVLRVGGGRAALRSTPSQSALIDRDGRADRVSLSGGAVSLAQVATTLPLSAGAGVYVLRATSSGIQTYELAAQDAVTPTIGGRFLLQPGDVVTLQARPAADPNQLVAQLSPALRLMEQN